MVSKIRNLVMICVVFALACGSAYAQSSMDVFGGYSYQRLTSASGAETDLSGWAAEAQLNMTRSIALVTAFSGGYGTQAGADSLTTRMWVGCASACTEDARACSLTLCLERVV